MKYFVTVKPFMAGGITKKSVIDMTVLPWTKIKFQR